MIASRRYCSAVVTDRGQTAPRATAQEARLETPRSGRGTNAQRAGPRIGPDVVTRHSDGRERRPLSRCDQVRPLGFEPRTNGLRVHCSAIELEAQVVTAVAAAGRKCTGRRGAPDTSEPIGVSEGT